MERFRASAKPAAPAPLNESEPGSHSGAAGGSEGAAADQERPSGGFGKGLFKPGGGFGLHKKKPMGFGKARIGTFQLPSRDPPAPSAPSVESPGSVR